jgi:hypothetical protein
MDIFNVPNFNESNKIFLSTSSAWQVWNKPSSAKFVYFYMIGSGAGGGGGRTCGNNSGGGGGGGASAAIAVGLYPAFALPDILYVQVPVGGASATAGQTGSSGGLSYISVEPNTTTTNIVMQSGAAGAGGGAGGTNSGTGAGSGGTAGTIWTYSSNPFQAVGMISVIPGQAGATGGGNTPSSGSTITPIGIVSGGTGGGGVSAAGTQTTGGIIIGSGFLPSISGGSTSSTATLPGLNGYCLTSPTTESFIDGPLFFTGGTGGASSGITTITAGGLGGNGSYGSGGGGGGASYGSTGGVSGKGGDGLVLIVTW